MCTGHAGLSPSVAPGRGSFCDACTAAPSRDLTLPCRYMEANPRAPRCTPRPPGQTLENHSQRCSLPTTSCLKHPTAATQTAQTGRPRYRWPLRRSPAACRLPSSGFRCSDGTLKQAAPSQPQALGSELARQGCCCKCCKRCCFLQCSSAPGQTAPLSHHAQPSAWPQSPFRLFFLPPSNSITKPPVHRKPLTWVHET